MKEARDLKRALNVDFEISSNHNNDVPLTVFHQKLDNDLSEMRELYHKRKYEIEECLRQQEELCAALEERQRPLSSDPLPTEAEVSEFEVYLVDLREEKLRRENEINNMKQEIKSIYDELDLSTNCSAKNE